MAVDCTALQAQYDQLQAAYLGLLTGKRVVSVTYGDQKTDYAQSRDAITALKAERDAVANLLATQCGVSMQGASSARIATPSIGNGRCY